MNQPKPLVQHADAVRSEAFTGNLQRASLLPGEIAVRPPISQDVRAAAGTGGYPQTVGASIYQRHLADKRRSGQARGHLAAGQERVWWYWPSIATTVVIAIWMAVAGPI